MPSFVTTDHRGQFILDGKPWFLHGATYFGRRPGSCGANWMGEHFEHNMRSLRGDLAKMNDLGFNAMGLFVPGGSFFSGIKPDEKMFGQLSRILDEIAASGLRAVVFPCTVISQEQWCQATGAEAGTEVWNPAVHVEAEKAMTHTVLEFARRYGDRPEVLGYMRRAGRLDPGPKAPVRSAWSQWLQRRFGDDFAKARELLELESNESDWTTIRLPAEMPANFSRSNPRAFECCLMQQVLISQTNSRLYAAIKQVAPRQLTVNDMEGTEFAFGSISVLVPEMATADVLWLECYNWEGMRGPRHADERIRAWLVEPAADKPNTDLIMNAGYVQMLIRWMQRSGKALVLCHGTDIGHPRGVRTEHEHALMLDRFNSFIYSCGAHGINYWCFSDDELSRSAVAPDMDLEEVRKLYPQAGETMGLLRPDGSERPVVPLVRSTSRGLSGKAAYKSPHEVLVLFPAPIFQSLYRYRSNCTGFGLFTSLARQGLLADAAFTSAGERLITAADLAPYRLVILGIPEYHRDHPEIPEILGEYVSRGGTLFLPLAHPERLDDPYVKPRTVAALAELAGCRKLIGRENLLRLDGIASHHSRFNTEQTESWELPEDGWFTAVEPIAGAEILVEAAGRPLLYRHRIGTGTVYAFAWTLDVLLFKGQQYDYPGGNWDWLWQGLAAELNLRQDPLNPMSRTIREMTYRA